MQCICQCTVPLLKLNILHTHTISDALPLCNASVNVQLQNPGDPLSIQLSTTTTTKLLEKNNLSLHHYMVVYLQRLVRVHDDRDEEGEDAVDEKGDEAVEVEAGEVPYHVII